MLYDVRLCSFSRCNEFKHDIMMSPIYYELKSFLIKQYLHGSWRTYLPKRPKSRVYVLYTYTYSARVLTSRAASCYAVSLSHAAAQAKVEVRNNYRVYFKRRGATSERVLGDLGFRARCMRSLSLSLSHLYIYILRRGFQLKEGERERGEHVLRRDVSQTGWHGNPRRRRQLANNREALAGTILAARSVRHANTPSACQIAFVSPQSAEKWNNLCDDYYDVPRALSRSRTHACACVWRTFPLQVRVIYIYLTVFFFMVGKAEVKNRKGRWSYRNQRVFNCKQRKATINTWLEENI